VLVWDNWFSGGRSEMMGLDLRWDRTVPPVFVDSGFLGSVIASGLESLEVCTVGLTK